MTRPLHFYRKSGRWWVRNQQGQFSLTELDQVGKWYVPWGWGK